MKKLLMLLVCVAVVSFASAQRIGYGYGHYYAAPRVVVSTGFGYNPYGYYGYPYGVPYYGYPYYGGRPYGYGRQAYNLQVEESNIRYDYEQKIEAVRADKTLKGRVKRERIRTLREQRYAAIEQADNNYYSRRYM